MKRARSPAKAVSVPTEVAEEESDITEMEKSRSFLLYNWEKNSNVLFHWENTFKYRSNYLKKTSDDLTETIQSWSIITKPIGVELVSLK